MVLDDLRPVQARLCVVGGKLRLRYPPGDKKVYVRPVPKNFEREGIRFSARYSEGGCTWFGWGGCIGEALASLKVNKEKQNIFLHNWQEPEEMPVAERKTIFQRLLNLFRK